MDLSTITDEEMQTYYKVKYALRKARYENMSDTERERVKEYRRQYMRDYRAKQKVKKEIC